MTPPTWHQMTLATTDSEGFEYDETQAVAGFHANLREELTDAQVAALPTVAAPTTPHRIWAGDE